MNVEDVHVHALLASFFLPSHLSLKHSYMYSYLLLEWRGSLTCTCTCSCSIFPFPPPTIPPPPSLSPSPDEKSRYISLTLLSGVSASDSVMQEEIFGPLLPFVTVENFDEAIEFIRARYLFYRVTYLQNLTCIRGTSCCL